MTSDASGGTIAAVIFLVLFLSAVGWYGWKVLATPHYPMVRTVETPEGEVKVRIVGREGEAVFVERISDGGSLVLALEDLPEQVRNEVGKLRRRPMGLTRGN